MSGLIRKFGHDLNDVLLSCEWKKRKYDCEQLFIAHSVRQSLEANARFSFAAGFRQQPTCLADLGLAKYHLNITRRGGVQKFKKAHYVVLERPLMRYILENRVL